MCICVFVQLRVYGIIRNAIFMAELALSQRTLIIICDMTVVRGNFVYFIEQALYVSCGSRCTLTLRRFNMNRWAS